MQEVLERLGSYYDMRRARHPICTINSASYLKDYAPEAWRLVEISSVLACVMQNNLGEDLTIEQKHALFPETEMLCKFCWLYTSFGAAYDIALDTFRNICNLFSEQLPLCSGTEAMSVFKGGVYQANKLLNFVGDAGKGFVYIVFMFWAEHFSKYAKSSQGVALCDDLADISELLRELLGLPKGPDVLPASSGCLTSF